MEIDHVQPRCRDEQQSDMHGDKVEKVGGVLGGGETPGAQPSIPGEYSVVRICRR